MSDAGAARAAELAKRHEEVADLRDRVRKADESCEWCKSYNQRVRREQDDAQKKHGEAEAELELARGENESNKEIIEALRRELANHASEHAELERLRTEVAKLGPRVTEQAMEIKRLMQIECCWKAHEKRAAHLPEQQGALAGLYEYRHYCRRDYFRMSCGTSPRRAVPS
jgi:chromosome segregation ATPase